MIKFVLDCLLLLPLLIVFILESLLKSFIPKKRKSVTGEIVLITGAGHGIGRLTAHEFAKLKSKLVLWDINKVIPVLGRFPSGTCNVWSWVRVAGSHRVQPRCEGGGTGYYCRGIDGGKLGLINVFMIVW